MLHIRNSIKGIFILENGGIPTEIITDFSEPINNGSLCIDNTNDELYILKNGIWTLVGTGTSSDSVIDTSYSNLQNSVINAELIPGTVYKMDIETIHMIPFTVDINIGNSETILIQAVSTTEFDTNVISVQYPNDIIYYDFNSNFVEDFITPRKGKITYRKDTISRLETWYDWRNVKFRRWEIDTTTLNNIWVQNDGIGIPHQYSLNDIVYHNDIIYKCINTYESLIDGPPNVELDKWIKIVDISTDKNWSWDPSFINIGGGIIFSGVSYKDVLTFESGYSNIIKSQLRDISIRKCDSSINNGYNNIVYSISSASSSKSQDTVFEESCRNMTVTGARFYSNRIEQGCYDMLFGYGFENNMLGPFNRNMSFGVNVTDINFGRNCYDIVVSDLCYDINISNGVSSVDICGSINNIKIGSENYNVRLCQELSNINIDSQTFNIFINSNNRDIKIGTESNDINILSTGDNNMIIGNNCSDILIENSGNSNLKVGIGCSNVSLLNGGCFGNMIGDNCTNLILNSGCSDNMISSGSFNISIIGGCGGNVIHSMCSDVNIVSGSSNNTINNMCVNVTLDDGCRNNIFDSECFDITFMNGTVDNIIGVRCGNIDSLVGGVSSNIIGANSNDIVFGGGCTNNVFNSSNSNVVLEDGSSYNYFASGFGGFSSVAPIQNVKFVLPSTVPVSATTFYGNIVIDMVSPDGSLWYKTIDDFGSITTSKIV